MNYAYEIRRQAEAAPRAALPAVASALWKAFGEGHLSEAEAEMLAAVIEARMVSAGSGGNLPAEPGMGEIAIPSEAHTGQHTLGDRPGGPRTGVGSRPRTDASMERRRHWAASGRLPPAIAARFTLAEQAVLSLVAAETVRRKDCRLAVEHLAAIVGVCRSTVKNAVREARKLGLLSVEERPVTGFRNLPNVIRIVSPEWTAWLRLARKGAPKFGESPATVSKGVGVKSTTRTPTDVQNLGKLGSQNRRKGCRQAAGDFKGKASSEIRAAGRGGQAMR